MRTLLDEMLESHSPPAGGARIVSEQHDLGKINTGGDPNDPTGIKARIASFRAGGPWDAAEYGISREEQITRLEAADTPEKQAEAMQELQARAIRRAGLDTSRGKVAAAFAGKPAWHGLGTLFDQVFTSEQGIVAAGQD